MSLASERIPFFLKTGAESIFGWHHLPKKNANDLNIILVPPLGTESIHSHRSYLALAELLAAAGHFVTRFDFYGHGDSTGSCNDEKLIPMWINQIRSIVELTIKNSGSSRTCLFGVRFGATLATLANQSLDIESLILWNPIINGKRYARELQATAATAADSHLSNSEVLEVAGFAFHKSFLTELSEIQISAADFKKVKSLYFATRDDQELDAASAKLNLKFEVLTGLTDMLAEPQFTKIPLESFSKFQEWLSISTQAKHSKVVQKTLNQILEAESFTDKPLQILNSDLFGFYCQAKKENEKTLAVLFNAGSVRHVGPNNLYTTLARHWATQGLSSIRLDLGGLGDSAQSFNNGNNENHPYPDSALVDSEKTLHFFKEKYGYKNFILIGLCSGAHTAFHSGINLQNYNILDTILINPLTYNWVDGMSLETTTHFQEAAYYKDTMKDGKKWIKLLKGQINFKAAFAVVLNQFTNRFKQHVKSTRNTLLSKNLAQLFIQQRHLSLFVAAKDPGFDLLKDQAKELTKTGLKSGNIRLEIIEGADHTFTRIKPRQILVDKLTKHLLLLLGAYDGSTPTKISTARNIEERTT